MPYISIEIDLDDVYDGMSNRDKKTMVEWLEKDGFCELESGDEENDFYIENPNVLDDMWVDTMKKLFHGRMQLSLEDEETIRKIANKL